MNTITMHDWNQAWEKLGAELPGLTDTDLRFAQECVTEIVRHLMRRTGRNCEDIEAAMRRAGFPVPKPSPVRMEKREPGKASFAGEGSSLEEYPAEYLDASGIPENTSQSGTSALTV